MQTFISTEGIQISLWQLWYYRRNWYNFHGIKMGGHMNFSGTHWKCIAWEFPMLFQFVPLIFTLDHLFNVFFTGEASSPGPTPIYVYTISGTNWNHYTEIFNAFPMRTANLHTSPRWWWDNTSGNSNRMSMINVVLTPNGIGIMLLFLTQKAS